MNKYEVDEFVDKVDEVSRLIAGLKEGTISPSYVQNKHEEQEKKSAHAKDVAEKRQKDQELTPERKEELMRKVKELKERQARKERARQRLSQYIEEQPQSVVTDYEKWDLWVPSDEDDDLIQSCTPNTPEFKAMEKDIDERHKRMVSQRQMAQRQKEAGNTAYRKGQVTEAYRCYSIGLESERHNMELHANAAMASIRMGCHVQALEHCDKDNSSAPKKDLSLRMVKLTVLERKQVLHIADALHDKPNHPLCVKALQRRAVANKALLRHKESVNDLTKALNIDPSNKEAEKQLKKAKEDLKEKEKEKLIADQVGNCDESSDRIKRLRKVEDVVKDLRVNCVTLSDSTNKSKPTPIGLKNPLPARPSSQNEKKARGEIEELHDLLSTDDDCRVHFRGCGGVDIIGARLKDEFSQAEAGALVGFLKVIQSTIKNSGNMEIVAGGSIVSRLVELFVSVQYTSVDLRHQLLSLFEALSVDDVGRKALARELAHCLGDLSAFSKLIDLIDTGTRMQKVSILSILSRCMLETSARSFMRSRTSAVLKLVVKMETVFRSNDPTQVEFCSLLLSNLCGDERLRKRITEDAALMESLAHVVTKGLPQSSMKPCIAALANCLLEPTAQRSISQWHRQIVTTLSEALSSDDQCTVASATLALSRLAKCDHALSDFDHSRVFTKMVSLVNCTTASDLQCKIEDGIVRTVSTFSTKGKREVDHLVRCGVVSPMLKLLIRGNRSGGVCGNVSLLLSNIASHAEHIGLLKGEDCIKALVDVAHKSEPTSRRNAAIALARIAQDPSCLDIVRKFHGFEVMYSYVKP
ncbi:hypothetical protein BSKO_01158 [Bryopsis sp. KO-2023]|nr:hypothetical protein BSKO_01158 [Bryopsis sp. KO-2023]